MKLTVVAAALVGLIATACGNGDDPAMDMGGSTATSGPAAAPTRTVNIAMMDIAYEPKTVSAQQGERIEFVFDNKGKLPHDAFIGDAAAQAEHEKEMGKEEGSMAGDHDTDKDKDKNATAITVEPGQTGRVTYTFDKPGTIEIGCHEPGHYAAGMKVIVTVA